ncbi:MAG TPA: AAA family ATPase, partial [Methylocella sp.]|nr:AAA family ATPase [Methylocella sp.]
MKLQIERPYVERMVEAFPSLAPLAEQLRFGNKVEVPFDQFSSNELLFLQGLYREAGPKMQGRFAQLSTLQRALNDKSARFDAGDLEAVLPAVVRYLVADAIRGWIFTASAAGRPLPYVITRLDYTPPSNEETGRVFIEMKANAKGAITSLTLRISAGDIAGKTVGEIFAAKGFVRETPELIAAYDETEARYYDWRARYGAQFSGTGTGYYAEDPSSTHRDVDWSRKDVIVLSSGGGAARLVNDEGILTTRALTLEVTGDILGQYLRKAAKSNLYEGEAEVAESKAAIKKGLFCRVPVHPYILMFHLELHHYVWVHAADLTPYAYQPSLKRKLILPEEQTDLIDILTGEMDVLMDDIISGKSGGTTV